MIDPIRWGDGMLRFGDALDCDYRWLPPAGLDDYATSLRLVGRKVEDAAEVFDLVGQPGDESAGLTVDAMRERARRLCEELTRTRGDIAGVAAAMHGYADALRTHRDALRDVRDHALAKGLEIRGDKVLAPLATPPVAGTRAAEEWEDHWRSYSTCFELMRDARTRRWEALEEMKAALLEHAGVRPRGEAVGTPSRRGNGHVDHGDGSGVAGFDGVRRLRRDAAQQAAEVIRAEAEAQAAHLRHREAQAAVSRAADELAALRRDGADEAALQAKRTELHGLERQARDAAAEAQDRAAAAEEQRARAHEAARDHAEARDRRAGRDSVGAARVSEP